VGLFKVVIPSGSSSNLIACVEALTRHEPELTHDRIIVVDDTDGEAREQLPDLRWIEGPKPFVFARNVNLGIMAADSDVVVLGDDGLLLTDFGFTGLVSATLSRSDIGISSPMIDGVVGNSSQRLFHGHGFRLVNETLAFVCVCIPKRMVDLVGLMDERFVGYGFDDDDYCFRVRRAGKRTAVWPGCRVDHTGVLPSVFFQRDDIKTIYKENARLFLEKYPNAIGWVREVDELLS
jgi:GT2 family glycosyltransferase